MRSLFLCDSGDVDKVACLCVERGLGIEVQAFYDPLHIERHPEAIEQHRRALTAIAPSQRSLHGPFADLCPGSMDPAVREVTRRRMEEGSARARQTGIGRMILHHGYVPGSSMPENWLGRSAAFWTELLVAWPQGFQVHLENVFEKGPELLAQLTDRVGDRRFSICLDVGHCHCHATTPVVEWIRSLGPRIGYVHLHDNRGEADEHLPLGRGTLPWVEVCRALEQHAPDAIWALEMECAGMERSLELLVREGFLVEG